MPFSSTGSLVSTDLDNTLRGYYRDNSDHTLTGTASETTLATKSVTGGDIGPTGTLVIIAAGTITNSGSGSKTIKLKIGSTVLGTITRSAANAQDWMFLAVVTNTASATQRVFLLQSTADSTAVFFDYITAAVDTSSNTIFSVTGTLANTADTITQTQYNLLVSQIG